jgi:tetratricopeptide (TPR) repeat protein
MYNGGADTETARAAKIGLDALEKHNYPLALQKWTEVLRRQPKADGAYYYRAEAYNGLLQLDKAIADLDTFLLRQPRSAVGFALRGILYGDKDDFAQGVADCNRAIALDGKSGLGYALRGDVYRLQGRYDKASQDIDTALRLNPKMARAWQARGRLDNALKDYPRAIRAYTQSARFNPGQANPIDSRGEAERLSGNYAAARADFRQGIVLEPSSETPHNSLAWLLAVCPDAKLRDGKTAVGEATIACTLTQWKQATYIDTLAAALAETGDFEGAVRREAQAAKIAPNEKRHDYQARLASYRQGKPWREGPANPAQPGR